MISPASSSEGKVNQPAKRLLQQPLSIVMRASRLILPAWALISILAGVGSSQAPAQRATRDLQALYDFSSASGPVIKDRSGTGQPIDLRLGNAKGVDRSKGTLKIRRGTLVQSQKPARRLVGAVKRSGEITVEAWIKPADTRQSGPARIVSLSHNSTNRNITLGQDGDTFDVRFRSTRTSNNGIPSLSTGTRSLTTRLTHLIYTRERSGRSRIYLNGKKAAETSIPGDPANWNQDYHLLLGNEGDGTRPWLGSYHLVAVYSRGLSSSEVMANFKAGPSEGGVAPGQRDPRATHFENKVAPILANHCIECHDPGTRKGKLDLTRRSTAFVTLKDGISIVPGNPEQSLLWETVFHDEMPEDNDPLNKEQKATLRTWIEDGAVWPLARIDPANYVQSSGGIGEQWIQRLTAEEYIATVKATVGVDITAEAHKILPPDLRADGFANTAYNLSVDLKHIDAYARLAEIIVGRMDPEKFAARFSRDRRFTDKSMEALIRPMGTWILRGPLEQREIITYRGVSTAVAAGSGSLKEAVGYIIQAMLQSPRFIYRIENQRGDGSSWPVDDYELASRLSYIIWGASPDEELMRAARDGNLPDPDVLARQAGRMLEDPRAIKRSVQFLEQWLNLRRLANMRPDPKKFPRWNTRLAEDMRRETIRFFKEVVWTEKRPLTDLFNAQVTFLTPRLADHYSGRITPEERAGEEQAERYDLSANPARGGLLTQGSVLTMGGDDASMVTRGLFVMNNLLRGVVKDPPPEADTAPVPARPGLSHRGAAEKRIADKSCGGCHSKFEPLAFALEKYDGLGTFHEKDPHDNSLREDGEVLFPGQASPVAYKSAAELMDLLATNDRVRESLIWKVCQFSLGRPLGFRDAPVVQKIHAEARKKGGTWPALMTALITSDLVRLTRTEAQ